MADIENLNLNYTNFTELDDHWLEFMIKSLIGQYNLLELLKQPHMS